jgi:hypothetical protein
MLNYSTYVLVWEEGKIHHDPAEISGAGLQKGGGARKADGGQRPRTAFRIGEEVASSLRSSPKGGDAVAMTLARGAATGSEEVKFG